MYLKCTLNDSENFRFKESLALYKRVNCRKLFVEEYMKKFIKSFMLKLYKRRLLRELSVYIDWLDDPEDVLPLRLLEKYERLYIKVFVSNTVLGFDRDNYLMKYVVKIISDKVCKYTDMGYTVVIYTYEYGSDIYYLEGYFRDLKYYTKVVMIKRNKYERLYVSKTKFNKYQEDIDE